MPNYGGRSSVGRVQDCDSCCRGFDPHRPPHIQGACLQAPCFYPELKLENPASGSIIGNTVSARVAELVDAPDLGSGIFDVRVRVSPFAPFTMP